MTRNRDALAKERLRNRYRPARVRMLFVGEAPPASGRFFYQADSGLYRAIKDTFAKAFPSSVSDKDFLKLFQELGCYLVDLCGRPVDRLSKDARRKACARGEVRLATALRRLRPEVVISVVQSIAANVKHSQQKANWSGVTIALPYPGRWEHHRLTFLRALVPVLRKHLLIRDSRRGL